VAQAAGQPQPLVALVVVVVRLPTTLGLLVLADREIREVRVRMMEAPNLTAAVVAVLVRRALMVMQVQMAALV